MALLPGIERAKLIEGLTAVVDKRLGVQNNSSEFSQQQAS